jgi:uncharacterized protein (TIGR01777 family)
MKKLVIAGGTGFLGKELISHSVNEFDKIVVLSRSSEKKEGKISYIKWDACNFGDWCQELEGATAVINLCGKSVDCRYTNKNKAEILSSRVQSTKIIGEAIQKCVRPPDLWINGASATIYKHSENTPMTERAGKTGSGFSVEVCKAWEEVFNAFELPETRKVNLRISMVLGMSGGVLPVLLGLVKKRLGGTLGKGTQQISWINIYDFCRIIDWTIRNKNASGVYNVVSTQPVRNKDFMALLRKRSGIWFGLPAKAWMLEIGAFFIRTETELILKSRYAFPERLLQEGFTFTYPTIEQCLDSLLNK